MDIGTAIATSSAILGVVAVIFKIFPRNEKIQNVNPSSMVHCQDHSGVCATMEGFQDWLNKIEQKLDRVIEVNR